MSQKSQNIADLRLEYKSRAIDSEALTDHPITQFRNWFDEALAAKVEEPNAMALSTVSLDGHPACRIVLIKGITTDGITFFTNYDSRKGRELQAQPYAAATFFWPALERQVRLEGKVIKVEPHISDEYFSSRPEKSKIGAWASPQSEAIEDRHVLEQREERFQREFQGKDIPRPSHWGGYELVPRIVEFWQGRPSRLHDRIAYRSENGIWGKQRLAP